MKVAAAGIRWNGPVETYWKEAENVVAKAEAQGAELIVLPGASTFTDGSFQEEDASFLSQAGALSGCHPDVAVCPGRFIETEDGKRYPVSVLLLNGEILLKQRQLYLASWEREAGFERGDALGTVRYLGFTVCILAGADIFYPQTGREAALTGVNLVISPTAILKENAECRRIAGLWQQVQANKFFAVESGFDGERDGFRFDGGGVVYAPLEMTTAGDGFLAREKPPGAPVALLDEEKRQEAVKKFDVLKQLNSAFYRKSGMFGGGR